MILSIRYATYAKCCMLIFLFNLHTNSVRLPVLTVIILNIKISLKEAE